MTNENNNGNGYGKARRDENGLTDKQRRAIPILAITKPHQGFRQGVLKCEYMGIVTQHTYYHRWVYEPAFVAARDAARDAYLEEVESCVRRIFRNSAEKVAETLVGLAETGQINRGQVAACQSALQGAGIEEFQRKATNIQMQQTVVNEAEVRRARKERVKNHLKGIRDPVFDHLGTDPDQ